MTTEDIDVGEGVSSKDFDVTASKDMISMATFVPKGIAQLFVGVKEAAVMHPLATPPSALPQGFRDQSSAKQAICKQSDSQAQAWSRDLSRENCILGELTPDSPTSSISVSEIQDILAEKSLDSRLSRSVDAFIEENSYDGLDVQTCAASPPSPASRETSECFLELLDLRVAALGKQLKENFSDMLDFRMVALERRFSSEILDSRVESRLAALESHVLSETLDSHVEARSVALESHLFTEILDSRVEERLATLESQAAERDMSLSETARQIEQEVCALGKQMQTMSSRIAKITSWSQDGTEHIAALDERMVALDRSLSELRCEYLEGCLRQHQMEELVIALHSNMRDLLATQGGNHKHRHSTDDENSPRSPRRRERRQAKLETISETLIEDTADCVLAKQRSTTQGSESGKAVTAVEAVPLGHEETEGSLAEPEPETQEFSTSRQSTPPGAEDILHDDDNVDSQIRVGAGA